MRWHEQKGTTPCYIGNASRPLQDPDNPGNEARLDYQHSEGEKPQPPKILGARKAQHHAAMVTADIEPADFIAHDDHDVGLSALSQLTSTLVRLLAQK
jgi:hypothetical protein